MKVIVFFQSARFGNHVHPFLIDEVKGFLKRGHSVSIVCEKEPIDYSELSMLENVTICFFKKRIIPAFISSLVFMFNKYVREEIKISLKTKRFGFSYLRDYFRISMIGFMMYSRSKKLLKATGSNVVLDSYWFSNGAVAAALLKRKWKDKCVAFSRAHSFEIDPLKNKFCFFELKNFTYQYLDFVGFISEYGRNFFISEILKMYKNNNSNKCLLYRLGTGKSSDSLNPRRADNNCVTIVSCSRIAPEKRVELIAKVLTSFSGLDVTWYHFGPGRTDDILEIVKASGSSIKCMMMGDCTNQFIHNFYKNNHVDCFMNLSISEGIPVSIMEAFSYGIPCIATPIGGIPEIVEDNYNGFLISESANASLIIEKIKNLLSNELYRKNAFHTWSTKYDFESNFDLLCEEINRQFIDYEK